MNVLARGYLGFLNYPRTLLGLVILTLAVAGVFATRFSFDASSETLVVKDDPDLAAYQRIASVFGGDEFLLLTFSPLSGDPLDAFNLAHVQAMQADLEALDGVQSVFSILNVPLLRSPPVPIAEMANGFKTLASPDVDIRLAKAELLSSPLFRELLISTDAATTAMRIDLAPDERLKAVVVKRDQLRGMDVTDQSAARELALADQEYTVARAVYLDNRERLIAQVRAVRDRYKSSGIAYLGGVPMIAADMISFVKTDLIVFGGTVVVLMMGALYLFFRQARWVIVPISACAVTIALSIGVLGFLQRPATVISSNFISLIIITNVSLIIHLIVRYRELLRSHEAFDVRALVHETMLSKFAPCLYTALTTMAAFGSLISSRILPVEDFGWMMCLGIAVGFLVTFTFFPAVLLLMKRGTPIVATDRDLGLTRALSYTARWHSSGVLVATAVVVGLAVYGISRLSLDNRFVDYFQTDTEIYQGMSYIDRFLGGTVPLDVVIGFAPYVKPDVDDNDPFADDFADDTVDAYPERYWFTRDKVDGVQKLHDFMDAREEIGKVVSIGSLETLARDFNNGEPLSNAVIAAVLGVVPEDLRRELIKPYASPEQGLMRITARIIESGPAVDRDALVSSIRAHAEQELGVPAEQIEVSGMMVLFNSMLRQLFSSQLDSLLYVLLATGVMFVVLLRSLKYAVLGLIPNIISAASVIAVMGFAGIPLDMMTTTIAAISVGIGVDNAIHYLYRFREEHARWGDVRVAIAWCHASIGRALYFTTLTIVIGFSVLGFFNFVPTIMFGLLTALAMALALFANLTVLPSLLVKFVSNLEPQEGVGPIEPPSRSSQI
ncbi:MAG: MMPL family transporter [Proteobacteria bacterium]|nr:MMPL family transporter [Pseudomonadota bacterium]